MKKDSARCHPRTKPLKATARVWGCSSDGRALQSHCRGQRFDSAQLHQPPAHPKSERDTAITRIAPQTGPDAAIMCKSTLMPPPQTTGIHRSREPT